MGRGDTTLTMAHHGRRAAAAAGVELQRLPGKHFVQEEWPPPIAERVVMRLAEA